MKKKPIDKPAAVDALLKHYNKTILELSSKIRRRKWELNGLVKLQRADRYVLHELMIQRRDYIKQAAIKAAKGEG